MTYGEMAAQSLVVYKGRNYYTKQKNHLSKDLMNMLTTVMELSDDEIASYDHKVFEKHFTHSAEWRAPVNAVTIYWEYAKKTVGQHKMLQKIHKWGSSHGYNETALW